MILPLNVRGDFSFQTGSYLCNGSGGKDWLLHIHAWKQNGFLYFSVVEDEKIAPEQTAPLRSFILFQKEENFSSDRLIQGIDREGPMELHYVLGDNTIRRILYKINPETTGHSVENTIIFQDDCVRQSRSLISTRESALVWKLTKEFLQNLKNQEIREEAQPLTRVYPGKGALIAGEVPPWVNIQGWASRLESTLYYAYPHCRPVLKYATVLRQKLPLDSPHQVSIEFVYCAALSTARRIFPGSCYCDDKVCDAQCETLKKYTKLPEKVFFPLGDELLLRTFGIKDVDQIRDKIREIQKKFPTNELGCKSLE